MERQTIGLTEKVELLGAENKKLVARIDTGATISSIHDKLAHELGWNTIVRTKIVKSASGTTRRYVVKGKINICGKTIVGSFTITDRSHMKYAVLVGQDVLVKTKCLIDPTQK